MTMANGKGVKPGSNLPNKRGVHPRATLPIDESIAAKLRVRRVEMDLSQEQLGELIGVSFQQIQKYEKCVNRITASRLFVIAGILKVPVTFFYGTAPTKDGRDVETLLNADATASVRLLRAYSAIENDRVRIQFVRLLEEIAGL